jgi:hypothetical protein
VGFRKSGQGGEKGGLFSIGPQIFARVKGFARSQTANLKIEKKKNILKSEKM